MNLDLGSAPNANPLTGKIRTFLVLGILLFAALVGGLIGSGFINPMIFPFVILGSFVALAVIRNPIIGLILLIFTVALDQRFYINLNFITFSASNIVLPLTFVGVLLQAKTQSERKRPSIPIWLIFVIGLYLVSGLSGRYVSQSFGRYIITTVGVVLTLILVLQLVKDTRTLRIVGIAYLVSVILQVSIGLAQQVAFRVFSLDLGVDKAYFFFRTVTPRSAGTHLDPNYYGLYLLPGLALALSIMFFSTTRAIRLFGAFLTIYIFLGIVVSWSRTSYLAALFIVGAYALMWLFFRGGHRIEKNQLFTGIILGAILFSIIFFLVLPGLDLPIISDMVNLNEKSVSKRYEINVKAVDRIQGSIVLGAGATDLSGEFVHNTYLYIMLRAGLLGILPFVTMVLYVLILGPPILKPPSSALSDGQAHINAFVLAFAALAIAALGFGIEGHKMLWLSLGLGMASIFVVRNDMKPKSLTEKKD